MLLGLLALLVAALSGVLAWQHRSDIVVVGYVVIAVLAFVIGVIALARRLP